MHEVPVWDLPTRVFHWGLVLLFAAGQITGGEEGVLWPLHRWGGYLIAVLLVFRLLWGFVGSPRTRFADFVHGRQRVKGYLRRLLALDPPRHIGHNPLGGWMVLLLLVSLALLVAAGLFAASRDLSGPLASLIPAGTAHLIGDLHGLLANLLLFLVAVHVVGVLFDWLLTGDNLVRAMVTGRKRLNDAEAGVEQPLAPAWRGAVVCSISALVVWLIVVRPW